MIQAPILVPRAVNRKKTNVQYDFALLDKADDILSSKVRAFCLFLFIRLKREVLVFRATISTLGETALFS